MVIIEEGEEEGEVEVVKGTIILNQMMVFTLYHREELKENITSILAGGRGEDTDLEGMVLGDIGGIGDADTIVGGS